MKVEERSFMGSERKMSSLAALAAGVGGKVEGESECLRLCDISGIGCVSPQALLCGFYMLCAWTSTRREGTRWGEVADQLLGTCRLANPRHFTCE